MMSTRYLQRKFMQALDPIAADLSLFRKPLYRLVYYGSSL